MATADEIFAAELGADNVWFEVDLASRQIIIPKAVTHLGVKSDADVMHVRFKLPRFYYDVDFSECKIGIDYTNAKGEEDRYEPKDVTVIGSVITFTWIVGRHAALYNGNVTFGLCVKRLNPADPDDPYNEFHTTKASLPILDGMETCEETVVFHTDLLEQWREQLFGTKDSLIADLNAASQNEQTAIQEKGAEVLATIPKDYAETFAMINHADRTKADAILCSAEGEVISVADASDDHVRNLRIFGRTTQVATTGKNLFTVTEDLSAYTGITWDDANQRLHIASGTYGKVITVHNMAEPIPDGTTVTLTLRVDQGYIAAAGNVALGGYHEDADKSLNSWQCDIVLPATTDLSGKVFTRTFTVTNTVNKFVLFLNTPTNVQSEIVLSAQYEIGDTATDFEQYSGGYASPRPEWSQALVSVVNPTVILRGANLFGGEVLADRIFAVSKKNTSVKDDVAKTVTYSGGGINKAVLIDYGFKKNQQYTLILYGQNTTSTGGYVNLGFIYDDGSSGYGAPQFETHGEDSYAVMTSMEGKTVSAIVGKWASGEVILHYEKCGLFEGVKTVRDFVPFVKEQSILVNYPLRGVGDIRDEIDFERGVYIQRVNAVTCDGTETITREERSDGTYRFIIRFAKPVKALEEHIYDGKCSHFTYGHSPIGNNAEDGVLCVWTIGNAYCRHDGIASADDMNVWLAEQYAAGTPVTMIYPLATPIETPLTASEIEAFKVLSTNFTDTTVLNDADASMTFVYNADTRTYLDRLPTATDAQVQTYVDAWLEQHFQNAEGVSF